MRGRVRPAQAVCRGVRAVCRWVVAGLLAGSLALTAGCGASATREDLTQALKDTQSAVHTTQLVLDLLGRERTTRVSAQATAGEMVDQIGLAQKQLVDVPADTPQLRVLRQHSQLVIADALVTVQDTQDLLATPGAVATSAEVATVEGRLSQADKELQAAVAEVGQG